MYFNNVLIGLKGCMKAYLLILLDKSRGNITILFCEKLGFGGHGSGEVLTFYDTLKPQRYILFI